MARRRPDIPRQPLDGMGYEVYNLGMKNKGGLRQLAEDAVYGILSPQTDAGASY